jgi:hypothetical protein
LWIQRPLPKLTQNRKRKRPAAGDTNGRKGKRVASEPAVKKTKTHAEASNHEAVTPRSNRTLGRSARLNTARIASTVSAGRGGGRAAKTQAKMKMDEQAKDLAEFQRQAATTARSNGKSPAEPPPPPRGTRLSKRLRGSMEEEDWQPVPDEWLAESKTPPAEAAVAALVKTGLESDDESALTSLSDDDEEKDAAEEVEPEDGGGKPKGDHVGTDAILNDRGLEVPPEMPSDFVEWETVSDLYVVSSRLVS